MPKTLRRFRSGDFRYLGGAAQAARVGNYSVRYLKSLYGTNTPRDQRIRWASCRAKNKDDIQSASFISAGDIATNSFPDAVSYLSTIHVESATLSTKFRGTRQVSQIKFASQTFHHAGLIQANSPRYSSRLPSCIDKQLRL